MSEIISTPTPNSLLEQLRQSAEEGLGRRLTQGPLRDNTAEARKQNNRTIADILDHTQLRYGFPFDDPETEIYLKPNQGHSTLDIVMRFSISSILREEEADGKRSIIVFGVCQQHAGFLAQILTASTSNPGELVQPIGYINKSGGHVLATVVDESLADALPREQIDPAPFNRTFDVESAEEHGPNDSTAIGRIIGNKVEITLPLSGEPVVEFAEEDNPYSPLSVRGLNYACIGQETGNRVGISAVRKGRYTIIFISKGNHLASYAIIDPEATHLLGNVIVLQDFFTSKLDSIGILPESARAILQDPDEDTSLCELAYLVYSRLRTEPLSE